MIATKPDAQETTAQNAQILAGTPAIGGSAATERGASAPSEAGERQGNRVILYERLTGEEARRRAMGSEPQGAGMPREAVEKVEYVEVWSTQNPADGYDFRMYSFGGALVASRSTRRHSH